MNTIKTLDDIYNDLTPGSFILYETHSEWNDNKYNKIDKIRAGIVVAIDVWDMAAVVGIVDICKFEFHGLKKDTALPTIEWLVNWSETHMVVGYWKSLPSLSEIKQAIRKYRNRTPIYE